MFSLTQVSDAYYAHIVGELFPPQTMNILEMFKDTINLLCLFKQHNLNLLEREIPAIERKVIEVQLKK